MRFVLGWSVFIGLTWFITTIGLQLGIALNPEYEDKLEPISQMLLFYGRSLGNFIAPVLQLALVLAVLLGVAKHFGVGASEGSAIKPFSAIVGGGNIQALIAIIIVVALAISALAKVGDVATLKDLALVVVGFYFGTRRREGELEAVAAGTAAGIVSSEKSRVDAPKEGKTSPPDTTGSPATTLPPSASPQSSATGNVSGG